MSTGSWLEDLEARLDAQLEAFLRANPQQRSLLDDQQQRERRQMLLNQRLGLRQEAEAKRRGLLRLAEEIRQWQGRVTRARAAGARDLADRAEAHIATLMEQGRHRWSGLAELGQRFAAVEQELTRLQSTASPSPGAAAAPGSSAGPAASGDGDQADLERAWRRFEAEQELEELRRRTNA